MTSGERLPMILIRSSTDADVPLMLEIYRHHISHGIANQGACELARFDAEDLKQRRKSMRKHRLPHLVAEIDGDVAGYAYVVPFRKRPAYRYTVKHSIYVHPHRLGLGVGGALLPELIEACSGAGYRQLVGYIDGENVTSLRLHESCGFVIAGRLPAVAYRFDRWADAIIVQRSLGAGCCTAPSLWGAHGPMLEDS